MGMTQCQHVAGRGGGAAEARRRTVKADAAVAEATRSAATVLILARKAEGCTKGEGLSGGRE